MKSVKQNREKKIKERQEKCYIHNDINPNISQTSSNKNNVQQSSL